jgi:hypothetical protein
MPTKNNPSKRASRAPNARMQMSASSIVNPAWVVMPPI